MRGAGLATDVVDLLGGDETVQQALDRGPQKLAVEAQARGGELVQTMPQSAE